MTPAVMPSAAPMLATLAFAMLAAGTLGGVTLLALAILRVPPPRWLRMRFGLGRAHGLLNLAGAAVLFAANLIGGAATPTRQWWALGVIVAALIGGLVFVRALFPLRVPPGAAALHGALALAGLWLLAPAAGLG